MTPQEAAEIARKIHTMVPSQENQVTAVQIVTEVPEEREMILAMILRIEETSHS